MARLLTEGAENGTIDNFNGYTGITTAASTTYKRTGSYGIHIQAGGRMEHALPENESELYLRWAALFPSTQSYSADVSMWSFYDDDAALQCALVWDYVRQQVDIEVNGTAVALGTITTRLDTWHVMEAHVVFATSGGSITIKINGTTDATFTGNTAPTGKAYCRRVTLRAVAPGKVGSMYYDDIGINNTDGSYQNSWLGLGGVFYLEPTADGDQNDWTPSSGTVNYAMVDDIPPDGVTTYVQGLTAGETELYEIDDCPQYINTINLVQVLYEATLVTSGYNEVTDIVKVGGTVYSGTPHVIVPITPSFSFYLGTPHYINPSTGSAWGTVEVNATQAGIEITV